MMRTFLKFVYRFYIQSAVREILATTVVVSVEIALMEIRVIT